MDSNTIVGLVKERMGIRHNMRDTFLTAIVMGVLDELEKEKGLELKDNDFNHMILVVDYAAHRAENPNADMPRSLQFRLHNLMVKN